MKKILIIGAGLAGCEAAYQITKRGIPVILCDIKPENRTPAHSSADFAELVCSNSLKSEAQDNAHGLLKAELRILDSLILRIAGQCRVPAGTSLSVDREAFARAVNAEIKNNPLIETACAEATDIPEVSDGDKSASSAPSAVIIATGPLTSPALLCALQRVCGNENLAFYDAAAPIIFEESIDKTICFPGSRWGKGGADDYLNCPFTREQYDAFYDALTNAPTAVLKPFETPGVFEGCMPVEVLAKRGRDALRFGPARPVGFTYPDGYLHNNSELKRPYAIAQLRREKAAGLLYNIVGFQTNLTFPAQRKVFRLIPGLENAEFARYGVMHRNAYLNAPLVLDKFSMLKSRPGVFIAGQLSGVEGYVESTASGLIAGINAARLVSGLPPAAPGPVTMTGALMNYLVTASPKKFQPMNANFGILPPIDVRRKDERYAAFYRRAMEQITYFER